MHTSSVSWKRCWDLFPGIKEGIITKTQNIQHFVSHHEQGSYLTIAFDMPPETEVFSLSYRYERHRSGKRGEDGFASRQEINIIDLGLLAPDGTQVGTSGSDKTSIQISETQSTPGYQPCALLPGHWNILLGAYKIAPEGVMVDYELSFTSKRPRLFKGDLHTHTLASDGVLSAEELAQHALRHGLDFLAISDHNQMSTSASLPQLPGLTLIPGIEWTHFQGHASFLGVDQPYDEPFYTNSPEEVQARFQTARTRGAFICIDHPFDELCPFKFDLNTLPFDCIEVWNGPMRLSNLQAIGAWNHMLCAGKKIPVCGGSDYHRSQLFLFPGGPTTCVTAMSPSPADILSGLRQGHAYITFAPDGPELEQTTGDAIMGDSVRFSQHREMQLAASGLQRGDVLQVVTPQGSIPLLKAETDGDFQGSYKMEAPGFARVEILREFIPGIPPLPALISNPIYFDPD